jgi:cobalt-zinc-cadmium resistance protein CzcA
MIHTADEQLTAGDIDFLQWTILIQQSISVKNEYINMLDNYNQAVIQFLKLNNL